MGPSLSGIISYQFCLFGRGGSPHHHPDGLLGVGGEEGVLELGRVLLFEHGQVHMHGHGSDRHPHHHLVQGPGVGGDFYN